MAKYSVPIELAATASVEVDAYNGEDAKAKVRLMFQNNEVHAAQLDNQHTRITSIGEPVFSQYETPESMTSTKREWTPDDSTSKHE